MRTAQAATMTTQLRVRYPREPITQRGHVFFTPTPTAAAVFCGLHLVHRCCRTVFVDFLTFAGLLLIIFPHAKTRQYFYT